MALKTLEGVPVSSIKQDNPHFGKDLHVVEPTEYYEDLEFPQFSKVVTFGSKDSICPLMKIPVTAYATY